MPILIEACVGTLASARAAAAAGAGRLELCSGLVEGGLTPSLGLLERVLASVTIPVHVLIRPRGGDFLYEADECAVIRRDIELARAAGAHGVVIGALKPDGTIDGELTRDLITRARPLPVTFHRAFDLCRDAGEALDLLLTLGTDRLLTSGQAPSALEGAHVIAGLVRQAAGRMAIMAGGGVSPENVEQVIRSTGVNEIHVGASGSRPSTMQFRRDAVWLGKAYQPDEYQRTETDPDRLASIIASATSSTDR